MCPLTSAALEDEAEVLEAAAIDLDGPLDAVRLAWTAAFSNWRQDATVDKAKLTSVRLSSTEALPGILDGEGFEVSAEAEVRLVRGASEALRPRQL